MSDVVLDAIKSFLYERQNYDTGKLDGELHLIKGTVNIRKDVKFEKSIFAKILVIERHRRKEKIFYKVSTSKTNNEYKILKHKQTCDVHYFTKPIGSINIIFEILKQIQNEQFTIIINSSNFPMFIYHINNIHMDFILETSLNMILQNILIQFETIDYEEHQLRNHIL